MLGKIQQQGSKLLLQPPDCAFAHATIHYPSMQSQPGQPLFVGSWPSDHYFRSVCLSVCLCGVFLSRLRSDLDQTRKHVTCLGLVVSARIQGLCNPQKNVYFRGFGVAMNHHSVAASFRNYSVNAMLRKLYPVRG